MAFTMKKMLRYSITLAGLTLRCVKTHTFFAVTLDPGLTLTPEIDTVTNKIEVIIVVSRPMAGTKCGCSCRTMLSLEGPLV